MLVAAGSCYQQACEPLKELFTLQLTQITIHSSSCLLFYIVGVYFTPEEALIREKHHVYNRIISEK